MPPRRNAALITEVEAFIAGRSDAELFQIGDVIRNEIRERAETNRTIRTARTKAERALKAALKCPNPD